MNKPMVSDDIGKKVKQNMNIFRSSAESNSIPWCNGQSLKFLPKPGPTTGLISFPISGNTWLRYMIQKVTGIITGSFYFSKLLYENGFPGENIFNGSVIFIKSHLMTA